MAFWASLKELSAASEEVIGAKARFDPEKYQKQRFAPAHFMCDALVLFKAISARASPSSYLPL